MKANRIVLATLMSLSVLAMTACNAPARNARNEVAFTGQGGEQPTDPAKPDGTGTGAAPIQPVTVTDPSAPAGSNEQKKFSSEEVQQASVAYIEESRAFAKELKVVSFTKDSLDKVTLDLTIVNKTQTPEGSETTAVESFNFKVESLNEKGDVANLVATNASGQVDPNFSGTAQLNSKSKNLTVDLSKSVKDKLLTVRLNLLSTAATYNAKEMPSGGSVSIPTNRLSSSGEMVFSRSRVRALGDAEDTKAGRFIFGYNFKSLVDKKDDVILEGQSDVQEYQNKVAKPEGLKVVLASLNNPLLDGTDIIQRKKDETSGKKFTEHAMTIQMKDAGSIEYSIFDATPAGSVDETQPDPSVPDSAVPTSKPGNDTALAGVGIETKIGGAQVTAQPEPVTPGPVADAAPAEGASKPNSTEVDKAANDITAAAAAPTVQAPAPAPVPNTPPVVGGGVNAGAQVSGTIKIGDQGKKTEGKVGAVPAPKLNPSAPAVGVVKPVELKFTSPSTWWPWIEYKVTGSSGF